MFSYHILQGLSSIFVALHRVWSWRWYIWGWLFVESASEFNPEAMLWLQVWCWWITEQILIGGKNPKFSLLLFLFLEIESNPIGEKTEKIKLTYFASFKNIALAFSPPSKFKGSLNIHSPFSIHVWAIHYIPGTGFCTRKCSDHTSERHIPRRDSVPVWW